MTWGRGTMGVAAISVALALPPPLLPALAIAKDSLPARSATFTLSGTNGYLISVEGEGNHVRVLVSLGKPQPGHFEMAEYSLQGAPELRNGIEADLGSLGEISVHFKPSGRTQIRKFHKPKGCKGPQTVTRRLGTFTGTIRFDGEEEYTVIDKRRVRGSLGAPPKVVCKLTVLAAPPPPPRKHGAYLGTTAHNNRLGFAAAREGVGKPASYVASLKERSGRVSIWRYVSLAGPSLSFKYDHALTSATVEPPSPFSGSATFQRAKGISPTWAGSLAVSFPGAANVPLTGSSFSAILTRSGR